MQTPFILCHQMGYKDTRILEVVYIVYQLKTNTRKRCYDLKDKMIKRISEMKKYLRNRLLME